jgi:hypothetical protein
MGPLQQASCGAWLVAAATGCMLLPRSYDARPQPGPNPADVEGAPAGTAASAPPGHDSEVLSGEPFVLESRLQARRIRDGKKLTLELGDGDIVMDGDRLQAFVRTSQKAYLYVAFCSQSATDARFHGLRVFPDDGAIHVSAHTTTVVPDRAAEIVLDNRPGPEALYLVLSRVELPRNATELAQAIAGARHGNKDADCRAPQPRTDPRSRPRAKLGRRANAAPRTPPLTMLLPRAGAAKTPPEEADPVVVIQRGGDIVWNPGIGVGLQPDPDGVVVLRYGLTHVAAP